MAAMPERASLKYYADPNVQDDTMHFLLVSSNQYYLDEMQKHLYISAAVQMEKRLYNLKVHTCKSISDVVSLKTKYFRIDFIIFIVDVMNKDCLLKVQENLNLLDFSFTREKICIVNPNPCYLRCAVKPFDLMEFAHQFQINIINGKFDEPKKILNVTKRILNLAEACSGAVNGIPLIGYI